MTYSTDQSRTDKYSLRDLLEQFAVIPEEKFPIDVPKGALGGNSGNEYLRLLQRMHDLNKIKTMVAPEIFAEESFPDANIVAEYVENRLEDSDLAAEYEKICTESDMLLAELISCFLLYKDRESIPVSVPRHCRHRLYYLACSNKEEMDPRESESFRIEENGEQMIGTNCPQTLFSPSPAEDVPDPDQKQVIRKRSVVEVRKSDHVKKPHYGFRTMGILFFLLIIILFFYGEKNREGESISGDSERSLSADLKRTPDYVPDYNDPDRFAVYVKSNPHLDQGQGLDSMNRGSENNGFANDLSKGRNLVDQREMCPKTAEGQLNEQQKYRQKSRSGKTDSIVSRELFIIPEINNAVFSR